MRGRTVGRNVRLVAWLVGGGAVAFASPFLVIDVTLAHHVRGTTCQVYGAAAARLGVADGTEVDRPVSGPLSCSNYGCSVETRRAMRTILPDTVTRREFMTRC